MTKKEKHARRAGTTLVELIVSMVLIEILAAMVIGVLGPATTAFAKLQKTMSAQSVIDNISEEIAKNLQDITGTVRIYAASSPDTAASPLDGTITNLGTLLEYQNPDGYVVLLSADGCGETHIYRGTTDSGDKMSVNAGRLLLRYYVQKTNSSDATGTAPFTYTYCNSSGSELRARSVVTVFTDKYYMNAYLAVTFAYPEGQTSGTSVPSLTVTVSLYEDEARNDLITSETTVVQLRYDAKCYIDGTDTATRTAVNESAGA